MTVTSTTTFNLTISEVIDEAAARVGGQPILGQEYLSAMRLLDLILTDWANRDIALYTLEVSQVTLSVSTTTYSLDSDTQDILGAVLRVSNTDTRLTRLSHQEWLNITDKGRTGRPTQFFIDKQRDNPVLYVNPLPTSTTSIFKYWRIRMTKDSNRLSATPDVHRRYLPALVSGLAYYIALRRPSVSMETKALLKAEYEEMLDRALEEDRDRATFRAKPRLRL